ncbi:MAG: NAD-dependent epimerase/dehydratase family protein [Parachlamydiaceae bacterium]
MSGKHVLITGAAGFIGFHLAVRLRALGNTVIGIDNYNDYYTPELKYSRSEQLKAIGVNVIQGDVTDAPLLHDTVLRHHITHFVHLAAQAGVRYSLINPQAYVNANITGFLNVLETCRQFPHIPLTYASSSSVYGRNTKIPFSENDPTDQQASFYGVTKRTNELMAQAYHHLYNISVTGLRFFTVYGPWGRPDMAYFSFAKAILENKPIDVYNFGNMQRDFTYIDDIVDGIVAAIDLEAKQEIFNLGNHHPELLSALITALEENLGHKAKMHHVPMQPGDVLTTYADIAHSQKMLGFSPKISLSEGIRRFASWYLEWKHHGSVTKYRV